jgi:tRNA (cmo5U34)-methyltransferase
MQRRDHHDWTSEAYVDEWVRRQRADDPRRAERFQLMCDLFPFPPDAQVTILDVGAGYGPMSQFILDRYPNAICLAQDGSAPMLNRAQNLMAGFAGRFATHQSDLFEATWLPEAFGPFDAAVSSSCLHNLRDFMRISAIYRDIREHLKPGGIFLNLDLANAPTTELQQRYSSVAVARRQREGA